MPRTRLNIVGAFLSTLVVLGTLGSLDIAGELRAAPQQPEAAVETPALWTDIDRESIEAIPEGRSVVANRYRTLTLSLGALTEQLEKAPPDGTEPLAALDRTALNDAPVAAILALPWPTGGFKMFRIEESPIFEPGLSAEFPEIKTFRAYGVDDSSIVGRLDWTPLGFHAIVHSPEGTVYIDPVSATDIENYRVYFRRDYRRSDGVSLREGPIASAGIIADDAVRLLRTNGAVLHTYRLAVAATGEYTKFHGGTVVKAMSAITTTVNRVNFVYERELGIRLTLVANNSLVVYTDASKDPYTDNNASKLLNENQSNLDDVIGLSNYDVGHVFSTGAGGLAALGSVCDDGFLGLSRDKARGATGNSTPVGDAFDVDYVAHELGHQFGGNHTFNGSTSSCGGNRNSTTAFEPGSGSTIMAYAGICGAENLQDHSDPHFHAGSADEILAFISNTSSGGSCGTTSQTGNAPPSVNAGKDYTVPKGTPFALTATGADSDKDSLTYAWEQMDTGPASPPDTDDGKRPLFRSFSPTSSSTRTFPRLADLLANTTSRGERLPTKSRTMRFRATARDGRVGGGLGTDDMNVTVDADSGPFAVLVPSQPVSWAGGSTQLVEWAVADTDGAPVSAANVRILLSTDGGNTFPTVLVSSTPNDGSASVVLPNTASTLARIRIEAVGNIFFDVSDKNFTLTQPAHTLTVTTEANGSPNPVGGGGSVAMSVTAVDSRSHALTYSWTASCPGSDGSFNSTTSRTPTWTAPATPAGGTVSCTLQVVIADGQGLTLTSSHAQTVGSKTLTGLTIGGASSLNESSSSTYTATAAWSDGSTSSVTPTWSENSSFASINSSGVLTAAAVTTNQTVTVTASHTVNGVTKSATKSVTIANVKVLSGLSISGAASLNENTSTTYTATASWDDGSASSVTPTWSENSSFASINASGVLTAAAVTTNQTVTVTASYTFNGVTKSATKSVTIANVKVLSGLSISGAASLNENTSTTYTATASWDDGSTSSVTPTWSENSSFASINASGVLTAAAVTTNQTVTVTASYTVNGVTKSATKSVTIANVKVLSSLSISGAVSLNENTSTTYTATASWDDGSTSSVTPTWSENSSFASINASGVLTAAAVTTNQTVTVTASYAFNGVTKSATKSVTIANVKVLSGLSISGAASLNENTSTTYAATASWDDGSTSSVTPTWSENSSFASINASGVLTAAAVTTNQTVTVTASYTFNGVTKSATKSVTIANVKALSGLSISGAASLNENTSTTYAATASWDDGSTSSVTPTWSENSSFASINSSGVLTAAAVTTNQTVTVTASYTFNGVTRSATKSVTIANVKVLSSLSISGAASLNENTSTTYAATASWDDGSTSSVTPTWSENSSFASINASGVLTAAAVTTNQTVTVTASYTFNGVTRSATKSVTIANVKVLSSLSISGAASLNENTSTTYAATASWDDGSTSSVTPTWSENSSFASINASGVLTAAAVTTNQTVTVTASYTFNGVTRSATKSVTIANVKVLSSLSISGAASLNESSSTTYTATANWDDGSTSSVTPTWSENSSFASINSSGVLTAAAVTTNQTVTVTASYTFSGVTKAATKSVTIVNRK